MADEAPQGDEPQIEALRSRLGRRGGNAQGLRDYRRGFKPAIKLAIRQAKRQAAFRGDKELLEQLENSDELQKQAYEYVVANVAEKSLLGSAGGILQFLGVLISVLPQILEIIKAFQGLGGTTPPADPS
jgi:hypothetical protein